MADSKLTDLPNETDIRNISDSDEMYAVINGQSRAITFPKLSEYVHGRGGFFSVLDFGATGDGVTNDSPAIQAAIDAASTAGGGIVYLPAGVYVLAGALVPRNGVSLRGVRPVPAFTRLCPDLGINLDSGSWLKAEFPGQGMAIEFNTTPDPLADTPLSNVEIGGLGFALFDIAIKGGALNHMSFGLGRLQDLVFLGEENGLVYTRHAIDIENFQHLQINHVKAFHCLEPFSFRANHIHCSPGNSVFIDLYAYMSAANGDYALRLQSTNGSLQLNTITIIRPQINWFNNPSASKSNILLEGVGSGQITQCRLIDTNTEGDNGAHITLINAFNCKLDIASSVSLSGTSTVVLRNSGCVVHSQSPATTIDCDAPSSSLSHISGIIHSITGPGNPPGIRTEDGQSPREYFTGLGRNGSGIRLSDGEFNATLENVQITQQITNFSGNGTSINLTPDLAGTVYITLTSAGDNRVFLPVLQPGRYGLEYTIVRKDNFSGAVIITARTATSISGYAELRLERQWDQATLRAADDDATWIVISTSGTLS